MKVSVSNVKKNHRMEVVMNKVLQLLQRHKHFHCQSSYALELVNPLFWYLPKSHLVIEWDKEQELFISSGKSCPSYWLWYFLVFMFPGVIGSGSCMWTVRNASENPPSRVMASAALACMGALIVGESAVLIAKVDELTVGLKWLMCLSQNLGTKFQLEKDNTNLRFQSFRYWRRMSFALQLNVILLSIIPPILAFGVVYVDSDPFIYTYPKLLSISPATLATSRVSRNILLLIRASSTLICFVEGCRLYCLLFPLVGYWLELQLRTLAILYQIPIKNRRDDIAFLKFYAAFQITTQELKESFDLIVGVLMVTGFAIFISCNIGTFCAYNILPLELYWIMPTVSLLCTFFICFIMPLLIECVTRSDELITKRKTGGKSFSVTRGFAMTKETKIILKRYSAFKPLRLSCASFYPLKKGSEIIYIYEAFLKSVDGILLPLFD